MSQATIAAAPGGRFAASAPQSDADPFDRAFFDDPYPVHAALRDAGPAVWLRRYGVWAVARYAEVHAILNNWQDFCSGRGVGLSDFAKETPWRVPSLVLEADPPAHTRARAVLQKLLSPAAVRRLKAGFAAAAAALVDEVLARPQPVDAIVELAEAFPLRVFPDAMGLPTAGRANLLPYGNMAFNAFGPRNAWFTAAAEDAKDAIPWIAEAVRRENLSPGGLGAQIHECADAGDVTHQEAMLLVRSLLTAGVDTTVSGIGAALYGLARFPDQWAALHADPALARGAFDEAIRFESPVQTFFRTATRAASVGGTHIAEGDKVLMLLASANRDPRRWPDPDQFDIERQTGGHVGFGDGIHMCVGQIVARLEGEVLLDALARRVARIEIVGEPVRRYNNTMRGLASLPVRLQPAG